MKKIAIIMTAALFVISCKPNANEAGVMDDSKQATIDSMNNVMAKQKMEIAKAKSIDSMKTIMANQQAVHNSRRNNQVAVAQPAPEAKKKGWSGAAKGAVIGAGAGILGGALIDKKKPAQGAIIGGLAGAGLGAGTGAVIDSRKK